MKIGLVGVGGAGASITEEILACEKATGFYLSGGQALAIDTDEEALDGLKRVGTDRRLLIGQTHPDVAGEGVDGDVDLAVEVAREDRHEILRAFDPVPIEVLDGIMVVAGLAGGTGGGAGAAIIEQCKEQFGLPVFAVAVLPQESEGGEAALRASRSLQSFVNEADNVIVLDNQSWLAEEGDELPYVVLNSELADRLVEVLSPGDPDGELAETRVDRSDLIRTLSTGGVSSLGREATTVISRWRRWFGWIPGVSYTPTNGMNPEIRVKRLVQRAVQRHLTLPCDVTSTERALIIISGPPAALSRKGFESARHWLEEELETVDVVAGDMPRRTNGELSAVVLLSNVTTVPRIEAMKQQALQAKKGAPRATPTAEDRERSTPAADEADEPDEPDATPIEDEPDRPSDTTRGDESDEEERASSEREPDARDGSPLEKEPRTSDRSEVEKKPRRRGSKPVEKDSRQKRRNQGTRESSDQAGSSAEQTERKRDGRSVVMRRGDSDGESPQRTPRKRKRPKRVDEPQQSGRRSRHRSSESSGNAPSEDASRGRKRPRSGEDDSNEDDSPDEGEARERDRAPIEKDPNDSRKSPIERS